MFDYLMLGMGAYTITQSVCLVTTLNKLRMATKAHKQLVTDQRADYDLLCHISQESETVRASARRLLVNLKGYTQNNEQQISGHALHDLLGVEIFNLEQALFGKATYAAYDTDRNSPANS